MNGILWLFAGGLVGLVMSLLTHPNAGRDFVFHMWVAVIGGTLGGWLSSPLLGTPSLSEAGLSIGSAFASVLGAVILLIAMRFLRRLIVPA